jgi:phosphatidylserine/phosphatidylglycerophosphate/cardiolipin synthase-like enzyme
LAVALWAATALCEAKQRGVPVVAIFDKSNDSPNGARRGAIMLRAAGVPVYFDPVSIAPNKLIIDGWMVIGGSFNLTKNANVSNLENCIFEDNPEIVGCFIANFNRRLAKVGERRKR